MPEMDPDDFAVQLAYQILKEKGVIFLTKEEAQTYLDQKGTKLRRSIGYIKVPDGLDCAEFDDDDESIFLKWFRRIFRRK